MKAYSFEYQDKTYDNKDAAVEAVAEFIGQDYNNIDVMTLKVFEDELKEIEVYKDGEYYGVLEDVEWELN